jgi:hypothetical protein
MLSLSMCVRCKLRPRFTLTISLPINGFVAASGTITGRCRPIVGSNCCCDVEELLEDDEQNNLIEQRSWRCEDGINLRVETTYHPIQPVRWVLKLRLRRAELRAD